MLNITGVKPMFNNILTTMNKYEKDEYENGIIIYKKGDLKEYQEVIAVGSTVRDIKVGDKVMINPIRYAKKKHQEGSLKDGIVTDNPIVKYELNVIKVNGENCLLLYDQDIMYIFEGEEIENKKDNKATIILPDNEIIC